MVDNDSYFFAPPPARRLCGLWVIGDVAGAETPAQIPDKSLLVGGEPPSDLGAIFVAPEA